MKRKTQYVCQSCGTTSLKWLGRCSGCGEWNTLVEESADTGTPVAAAKDYAPAAVHTLDDESVGNKAKALRRIRTGITELDRVLGGGMVSDGFVLLGGDPGIGKSTILLQMADRVARQGNKVLYFSGEESADQVRDRSLRLGVEKSKNILIGSETVLERAMSTALEVRPAVMVIDSLQTFASDALDSAPGSVSQLREIAAKLMHLAKKEGMAVWLVGHVTKDGTIAGPKVVEHMVDTVLYFEGEGGQSYRLLRTVKNRFGSSRELGVFEMSADGLREVENPSALFLSERSSPVPGTAIATCLEGTRPLLVELQALVSRTVFGMPRRTSVGMDANRVTLLGAILERHLEMPLSQQDLYFNVVGGLRVGEPAADLAAAAAIWSSFTKRAIPSDWAFFGEVGLTGEVRPVSQAEIRAEEAKKLGFKTLVVPKQGAKWREKFKGVELRMISRIDELPSLF